MIGREPQLRDPMDLVQRYEGLRSVALGGGDCASAVQGLGILLCRGMAAWVRAQFEAPSHPSPAMRGSRDEPALPPGLSSDLVGILAGMALAVTTEARA